MITVLGASWCAPCQTLKTGLTILGIDFDYVDVEQVPELAEGITGLPTMLFSDGSRYEGCPPIKLLEQMVHDRAG